MSKSEGRVIKIVIFCDGVYQTFELKTNVKVDLPIPKTICIQFSERLQNSCWKSTEKDFFDPKNGQNNPLIQNLDSRINL